MLKWEKTGRSVSAGMTITTYEAPDSMYRIESRKKAIRHANGSGVWYHTTYFLIDESGEEKEYWRLQDAKDAAAIRTAEGGRQ